MKTVITACAFLLATTFSFAQTLNFGIKGGANFSILDYTSGTHALQPGFNLGGIIDIGLHSWSIQPGIFYTTKGEEQKANLLTINNQPAGTFTSHMRLNYLEVPVNLLYHIQAGRALGVYLGGGPYFAYGISGKAIYGIQTGKVSFDDDPNQMDHVSYKNPDIGVNMVAGVLFAEKFMIDVSYDHGISNINSGADDIHTESFHISVGYMFR